MGFNPLQFIGGLALTGVGFLTKNPKLVAVGVTMGVSSFGGGTGPQPKSNLTARVAGVLTTKQQAPGSPIPVVYGSTKLGFLMNGPRVDPGSDNDKDYWIPGVLCHGSRDGFGIASIDEIYFHDRGAFTVNSTHIAPFSSNTATVSKLLGTDTQNWGNTTVGTVSLASNFASWASADAGLMMAGAIFKLTYDPDIYTAGVPIITAKVKGNFVEDHRDEITADATNTVTFTSTNDRIALVSSVLTDGNWTAGDRVAISGSAANNTSFHVSAVATNHLVLVTAPTEEVAASAVTMKRWAHPDSGGDNPALCVRDYLLSDIFGVGLSETDLDEDSFDAAASVCEVQVTNPEATNNRFIANGWLDTGQSMGQNLQELLSACRGMLGHQGGVFRMIITQASTAVTFELNEDNIIGDWEFSTPGADSKINTIKATYVDPTRNYNAIEVQYPSVDVTNTYLEDDNGWKNERTLDLPFTDDVYRAEQIIMTQLKESRAGIAVGLTATEEALKLELGDVVKVTHTTPSWDAKEFRVLGIGILPNATVRLLLIEYDATIYTPTEQVSFVAMTTNTMPNPWTVVAPTSLGLTAGAAEALVMGDGTYIPRIKVTCQAADEPFLYEYDVEAKLKAEDNYDSWGPWERGREGNGFYIAPVTEGAEWEVRTRAVNTLGIKSAWLSGSVTPDANPAQSTTAVIDGFSAAQNAAAPENGTVVLSADGAFAYSNLEDANTKACTYTAYYDIDATAMSSAVLCVVKLYVNDGATSTDWTEVDTTSYEHTDNLTDETLTYAGAMGADWDLRIGISYSPTDPDPDFATVTVHGEDSSPAGVTYNKVE